jgi:predicted S18 family serine protease
MEDLLKQMQNQLKDFTTTIQQAKGRIEDFKKTATPEEMAHIINLENLGKSGNINEAYKYFENLQKK